MAEDVWLTFEEAARRLGITAVTLRRMLERDEISPALFEHRGRQRVIHQGVLDAWVQQRRVKPGALAHLASNRYPKYREGTAK